MSLTVWLVVLEVVFWTEKPTLTSTLANSALAVAVISVLLSMLVVAELTRVRVSLCCPVVPGATL